MLHDDLHVSKTSGNCELNYRLSASEQIKFILLLSINPRRSHYSRLTCSRNLDLLRVDLEPNWVKFSAKCLLFLNVLPQKFVLLEVKTKGFGKVRQKNGV